MKITVVRDQRTIGTVSSPVELRTLLDVGRILPSDYAVRDRDTGWKTVMEVLSLPTPASSPVVRKLRDIGGMILIACAIIGVLSFVGIKFSDWRMAAQEKAQESQEAREIQNRKFDAYDTAEEFVRRALKAPSTAKFPARPEILDTSIGSYETSTDHFHAYGYVDAQNSFGAMLRQTWEVDLEFLGGKTWQPDRIVLGGKILFAR